MPKIGTSYALDMPKICQIYAQRCKNIQTCKQCLWERFPSSGKILAQFNAVLAQNWVISQFCAFWWLFLHILELYVSFGLFLHYLALLGLLRYFVRIRFLICPRYAPDVLNICPTYAQYMVKLCLIYAQDVPGIIN